MQHRKSPPVLRDVAPSVPPAERPPSPWVARARSWFETLWPVLMLLLHVIALCQVMVGLGESSIHGADLAAGVVFWLIAPVLVKTVCLGLILLRVKAGWRVYLLISIVLALLTLLAFDLSGTAPHPGHPSNAYVLFSLVSIVVTTWLLWVAIAPRWELFG